MELIKNPQTKASYLANHANKLQSIASYGCLAMCYLYCAGVDGSEVDYILNVCRAMDSGLIADDCTVLDADRLLFYFTGRKTTVIKKSVTVASIKEIVAPTPVRFDYNGRAHWVVVENGSIVFNSLCNSVCVNKGKPTTARVIQWT